MEFELNKEIVALRAENKRLKAQLEALHITDNGHTPAYVNIDYGTLEVEPVPIGKGHFAKVFKGKYHGTPVALKKLKVKLDEHTKKAFEKEARILALLRHPFIISLIGVSLTEDSCPVFVMELMEGGNLAVHLHSTSSSTVPNCIQVALDVAMALNFLHTRQPPILHRDIKSDNILVDAKCHRAKLGDVGLARITSATSVPTREIGTIIYMAPEMLKSEDYGVPVDVYAFGLLLYELYARKRPFDLSWNDEQQKMIEEVVRKNTRPVPHSNAPSPIRELMCHCWTEKPADRPPMCEVLKILDRSMQ